MMDLETFALPVHQLSCHLSETNRSRVTLGTHSRTDEVGMRHSRMN